VADRARPYLAVLSVRYRMLLQYRAAAFAGFVTQCFWGAIKLMVLSAFFAASTAEQQPMTFSQVVAYVWLGQALLGILPWTVDAELADKMMTGAVAYELLRPLDLYAFWFARSVAMRTATTSLRAIPMLIVAGIGLRLVGLGEWALAAPPSMASALAFVGSLLATVILASALTMVLHAALIWTISGRGFNVLMAGLVIALSGMVIPLPLFPDWLQPLLEWQPLRGVADVPLRIYSGHISARSALAEIAFQLAWAAVIIAIGQQLLAIGRRKLVVQGG
jgi:ABC-2 type transport system permease protein